MKTKLLTFIILLLSANWSYAQTDSITVEARITELETAITATRKDNGVLLLQNRVLEGRIADMQGMVDSLSNGLILTKSQMESQTTELNGQIATTQSNIDAKISSVTDRIYNRTILIGIFVLLIVLFVLVLYLLIKRRLTQNTGAIRAINETQKKIEEETIKLDTKLVELLESQYKAQITATHTRPIEEDHSLIKKIADEIVRLETNLSRMDKNIKGYKQLQRAVDHIKDNFLANGYEIVDMLGKPYNDGMKVTASFVTDESLADGEQIITGIIKPQINYKGVMIQSAQIQVSQAE